MVVFIVSVCMVVFMSPPDGNATPPDDAVAPKVEGNVCIVVSIGLDLEKSVTVASSGEPCRDGGLLRDTHSPCWPSRNFHLLAAIFYWCASFC